METRAERCPRPWHFGVTAIVAVFLIMIGSAPVWADVSSGWQGKTVEVEPIGNLNWCSEGVTTSGAQNRSYNVSNHYNYACSTATHQIDVEDGWDGVAAFATWNGYDCGTTGTAYNTSPVYYFGVGANLCSGHGFGCGTEYTTTANVMWSYYSDEYFGNGYWNSPDINLCPG